LLEGLDSLAVIDSALTALDHPLGRRSAARPQLLAVVESAPLLLLAELPLPEGDESRLLAAMLGAIGIRRETCSVAALLPWSTPGSRPARPDEVSDFLPFLQRALALAPQRCILALGQRAGQLAEAGAPLAALRGRALTLNGVTLLTTYAPAMLLRQPALKADAWADLQHLQALLEGHT
jgi:DNA polymerase